jgi:fibro-slime domain-containing protein
MIRVPFFTPRARRLVATGLLGFAFAVGCSDEKKLSPTVVVDPNEDPDEEPGAPAAPPPVDPSLAGVYLMPPGALCGNGELDPDQNEVCDDSNNDNGDGCSGNCLLVEDGFGCDSSGLVCERAEVCGDGVRVGSEQCDDGNTASGDGCTGETCALEKDFSCPEEGGECTSLVDCGDGVVSGNETCDDGGSVDGDGCSAACEVEEPGWVCPVAGEACTPICGDGLVLGFEQCDDGNTAATDGCNALCVREPGFACETEGVACFQTTCQDGDRQGDEQCDDGNVAPYDGCTAQCTNEPRCGDVDGTYTCAAVCGDGLKFPEEVCDDGNTVDGDGCSADCTTLEPGFECVEARPVLGDVLELPVVYRDFQNTHPQFEIDPQQSPRLPGMVLNELGGNGKPVYNPAFSFNARPWTLDGAKPVANGGATLVDAAQIGAAFDQWYTDVPGTNETIIQTLPLARQLDGSYQFAQSLSNGGEFFPIDGLGFGNQGNDLNGVAHNFHFTSEVRQWFEYQGGEQLTFSGDDDVWVFVNGQLTVDLGGIHSELIGRIQLDGNSGENSQLCVQDTFVAGTNPDDVPCIDFPVRMSEGVNEIVVFQAERHVTESNYTLTIQGFDAPRTACSSDCGDGIKTPDEACDDGVELNGSGYGFCDANCRLGPRCGDAATNGPEQCDNGVNTDLYRFETDDCAPGCVTPSFCGDGVTDERFSEQCDDGTDENDGSYGGCNADCTRAPRCGDGNLDEVEQCDDGNRRNNDGCSVNCIVEVIR